MSFPGTAIGLFVPPTAIASPIVPVSTFDPKSIPGILGWYKSDAGITTDGTLVTTWQDQSGNNNHLIQNDASRSPSLVNNALNNLPAVKFNNSFLRLTSGLITQKFSIFCILKPNTEGGSQTIIGSSESGFQYCVSSDGQFCNKTFVVFMGADRIPIPANRFNQINVRYDSPNLNFRLNKAPTKDVNYPTSFGSPSVNVIGRSDANNSEYFKGDLVELLIYPALSLAQIQQVEDYLASRMSAITPATIKDFYFDKTVFLSHFDGVNNITVFTDVKGHLIEAFDNVVISTAQSKFGGASAYFDGSGDYLQIASSPDFDFGTITFECWLYTTQNRDYQVLFDRTASGQNSYQYGLADNRLYAYFLTSNSAEIVGTSQIAMNTWVHLAFVNNNGTGYFFINGNLDKTFTIPNGITGQNLPLTIGRSNTSLAYYFQGYLDELRITKGIARYTQNFTPPTVAFSDG